MLRKGLIFGFMLIMPHFVIAGPEEINFDSAESVQIQPLLDKVAGEIPKVHLPPRPVIDIYGEADDGNITKLSPRETAANVKDKDSDGKHFTWVPGLKSAVFNMTCDGDGNDYKWQLRLMKPINMPERAGHDHALRENLPPGITYSPTPDLRSGAAYYIDGVLWEPQFNYLGEALTRILSAKSKVTLKIPDPKYATSIALPLQYSGACNSAETRYIDIMVPDLVALPSSGTTYVLFGGEKGRTTHYSHTHHGTIKTIAALKELAARWRATHPDSYKLAVNDISLPWGGTFDLKGDWNHNASHFNHSFGIAADISKRCVRKIERPALIKLMGEMGFTVKSEGDPNILSDGALQPKATPDHYHVQYQPELDRLLHVLIPPNNIPFPIKVTGAMSGVDESLEQIDTGADAYMNFPSNRNTDNCEKYIKFANACSSPANSNELKYCHCTGLFDGLNSEPENYAGCQK